MARGVHGPVSCCNRPLRAIPDGAGRTVSQGEFWALCRGPSPMARGVPGNTSPNGLKTGTIPEGAGRTTSAWPTRTTRRDHPRWRGAYQQRCPIAFRRRGPSPMARGVRGTIRRCMRCRGTIPEGAGRTLHVMYVPDRLGDHPRWRGAYPPRYLGHCRASGPSPRVRGVPRWIMPEIWRGRTIPEGAGRAPDALPERRV